MTKGASLDTDPNETQVRVDCCVADAKIRGIGKNAFGIQCMRSRENKKLNGERRIAEPRVSREHTVGGEHQMT